MKRLTLVGGGVLGGVLLGLLLAQQPFSQRQQPGKEKEKEKRVINANGSATVRVSPDAARLFFAVQTMAPKLAEARAGNAEHTQKVIAAVRKLQIPKLKSQDFTGAQTIEQHQAHHSKVAEGAKAVPEPDDFVSRQRHNDAPQTAKYRHAFFWPRGRHDRCRGALYPRFHSVCPRGR